MITSDSAPNRQIKFHCTFCFDQNISLYARKGSLVMFLMQKTHVASVLALFLAVISVKPDYATDSVSKHSAKEVLLVYNANSPISGAIAKDYARKRNVTNIVAIHCIDSAVSSDNETIPLTDYTTEIALPITNFLDHHKGINFIVLTKGVPIRIDGGSTGSKDIGSSKNLHPSVDSYLAAMDYPMISGAIKISITGSGATGYGWLNRYWNETVPFTHTAFGGYLVTRLDGYTQADAISLVDRALSAEEGHGPYGKVLLDVQPDFGIDKSVQPFKVTGDIASEAAWSTWNADLVQAADLLKSFGIPVDLDLSQTFVGNQSNLLGYFSWGSNDSHYTDQAYESLSFAPGSIGDTAVSTSARTFLPTTGGQSLIAELIAHGITGVKGYANEPLLQANASPTVAFERYFSGFNMAESFYAASRFAGWEDIVIGDPLGRLPPAALGLASPLKIPAASEHQMQ
jgi:uncharacterized protein (TIGR03790 family)